MNLGSMAALKIKIRGPVDPGPLGRITEPRSCISHKLKTPAPLKQGEDQKMISKAKKMFEFSDRDSLTGAHAGDRDKGPGFVLVAVAHQAHTQLRLVISRIPEGNDSEH
jgi:hypothetical protein